jgi:hypothetical protein
LRKTFGVLLALLFLVSLLRPAGTAERFSLRGYFKSFSVFIRPPAYRSGETDAREPDLGAVSSRLRLEWSYRFRDKLIFNFAYDLSPRIQDPRLFKGDLLFPGLNLPKYRLVDLRNLLYPGPGKTPESFGIYQNLDRFMLTVRLGGADIILGRQAVAWGSGRVINPTDVIAPFSFNELDKEERLGVDAVRIRVPLGPMDELDLGVVAGNKFSSGSNAFFIRGKTYLFKTDISGLVLSFQRHLLIGLELARAIGGAGSWLEAAYVATDASQESPKAGRDYFRASFGLDYNLSSKTYGFVEYHFNSAGASRPESYLGLFNTPAYQDGSVYLLGRHYLSLGATYQLSPLTPFTGLVIFNLNDGSVVVAPQLEYNIAENIYLAAGAYLGLGRKPEIILDVFNPPVRVFHSEFGAYPDMIFTSFRVYF